MEGPARFPSELTRTFDGHRFYNVMAGEDEREGGALLFFGFDRPLDIAGSKREFPRRWSSSTQARQRDKSVWIDIEKPFWWDVPVWLASGKMNSIGLANNHMCRSRMLANEAWGKPRDAKRCPTRAATAFGRRRFITTSQLRPAHSAVRRQRLGRAAKSGRLQPRLRASG